MSVSRWVTVVMDMLLVIFTVYLFFLYFGIFFRRNENKIRLLIGIIALVLWQFSIPIIVHTLEPIWNVVVGGAFTLLVVVNIFEGSIGMKCFFRVKCCVKLVSNHFSRTREVLIFLSLFANVWHKSYVTCSLDCYCKSSLVFCTVTCDSARKNFSSLRDVSL